MGSGHQGGWAIRRLGPREGERCDAAARHEYSRSDLAAVDGRRDRVIRRHLLLVDSITEAPAGSTGAVIVCGSHGGVSSGRFALLAGGDAVVFNDAGVGKDNAGIAALAMLQDAGIAAGTVAHTSACIGNARSTLEGGQISHLNGVASAMGGRIGMTCCAWVNQLLRRAG